MKKIIRLFSILAVILVVFFSFPDKVSAQSINNNKFVLGGDYTLESGRILEGNLIISGGTGVIEENASVSGNLLIISGVLTIDGTINGDVAAINSTLKLENDALIKGDIFTSASQITRDPDAVILGEESSISNFSMPNFFREFTIPSRTFQSQRTQPISIFLSVAKIAGLTLLMTALGGLLLLIMPKSSEVMRNALLEAPWKALGFGALTLISGSILIIFLAITICFIPFAVLLALALGLAGFVGRLILGYLLGKLIVEKLFKAKWHPAIIAAFGNLILYLLIRGLNLIPCLGGLLVFIISLFALGVITLTFFGTKPLTQSSEDELNNQVILNDDQPDIATSPSLEQELPKEENDSV
jgi:cytoskeletal protein CcmA (bactofilin family)